MNNFMKNTLLLSLLLLSCFSSFVYADGTSPYDEPAKPVEAIEYIALNEFPINAWSTGFNFTVGDKTVTITYGKKIASIKSGNVVKQYYFDENFILSQNKVVLSDSQYNLIAKDIENSLARRIRMGKTKYMPQRQNGKIYSDENLTKHIASLSVGTNVRVINSVLDGKLKVLTSDNREGYMDTRALNIFNDSLPPNVRDINFNTKYIILVSQDKQNMKIYMQDKSGKHNLVRQSKTSTGKTSTATPNGIFTIKSVRGNHFATNSSGGRAYYFVQFRENHLFHSVLYSSANTLD